MRPRDVRGPALAPTAATGLSTVVVAVLSVWLLPADVLPVALVALATIAGGFATLASVYE